MNERMRATDGARGRIRVRSRRERRIARGLTLTLLLTLGAAGVTDAAAGAVTMPTTTLPVTMVNGKPMVGIDEAKATAPSLTVDPGPSTPAQQGDRGEAVLVPFVVANGGDARTTLPVALRVTAPAGLRYAGTTTPGWTCAASAGALRCRTGSLAPAERRPLTLRFAVGWSAHLGGAEVVGRLPGRVAKGQVRQRAAVPVRVLPDPPGQLQVARYRQTRTGVERWMDGLSLPVPAGGGRTIVLGMRNAGPGRIVVAPRADVRLPAGTRFGSSATLPSLADRRSVLARPALHVASSSRWACGTRTARHAVCVLRGAGPIAAGASLPRLQLVVRGTGVPREVDRVARVRVIAGKSVPVKLPVGLAVGMRPRPELRTNVQLARGLRADGHGSATVTVRNAGVRARGLAVALPGSARLSVRRASGSGWRCAHASRGSMICRAASPLAGGATSRPIRLRLTAPRGAAGRTAVVRARATAVGVLRSEPARLGRAEAVVLDPLRVHIAPHPRTVEHDRTGTIDSLPDTTVLTGGASGADDSDPVDYAWTQLCLRRSKTCRTAAPRVRWVGAPGTAVARFRPPTVTKRTTLRFRLTARATGDTASRTTTLVVAPTGHRTSRRDAEAAFAEAKPDAHPAVGRRLPAAPALMKDNPASAHAAPLTVKTLEKGTAKAAASSTPAAPSSARGAAPRALPAPSTATPAQIALFCQIEAARVKGTAGEVTIQGWRFAFGKNPQAAKPGPYCGTDGATTVGTGTTVTNTGRLSVGVISATLTPTGISIAYGSAYIDYVSSKIGDYAKGQPSTTVTIPFGADGTILGLTGFTQTESVTETFLADVLPDGYTGRLDVTYNKFNAATPATIEATATQAKGPGRIRIAGTVTIDGSLNLTMTATDVVLVKGIPIDLSGTIVRRGSGQIETHLVGQTKLTAPLALGGGISVRWLRARWDDLGAATPAVVTLEGAGDIGLSDDPDAARDWADWDQWRADGGGNGAPAESPGLGLILKGTWSTDRAWRIDVTGANTTWKPLPVLTVPGGQVKGSIVGTGLKSVAVDVSAPAVHVQVNRQMAADVELRIANEQAAGNALVATASVDASYEMTVRDGWEPTELHASGTAAIDLKARKLEVRDLAVQGLPVGRWLKFLDVEVKRPRLSLSWGPGQSTGIGAAQRPGCIDASAGGWAACITAEADMLGQSSLPIVVDVSDKGALLNAQLARFSGVGDFNLGATGVNVIYSTYDLEYDYSPTPGTYRQVPVKAKQVTIAAAAKLPSDVVKLLGLGSASVRNDLPMGGGELGLLLTGTYQLGSGAIELTFGSFTSGDVSVMQQGSFGVRLARPYVRFLSNAQFRGFKAGGTAKLDFTLPTLGPSTLEGDLGLMFTKDREGGKTGMTGELAIDKTWSDAFGLKGMTVSNTRIAIQRTESESPVLAMGGRVTLPDRMSSLIGLKAGTPIELDTQFSRANPCARIQVGKPGGGPPTDATSVLDVGGRGILTASYAELAIAGGPCRIGSKIVQSGELTMNHAGVALGFEGAVGGVPLRVQLAYVIKDGAVETPSGGGATPGTSYDLLGVPRTATDAQIRSAYKTRALALNPDNNAAADAAEKYAQLTTAYETLRDRAKREAYDKKVDAGGSGAAPPPVPARKETSFKGLVEVGEYKVGQLTLRDTLVEIETETAADGKTNLDVEFDGGFKWSATEVGVRGRFVRNSTTGTVGWSLEASLRGLSLGWIDVRSLDVKLAASRCEKSCGSAPVGTQATLKAKGDVEVFGARKTVDFEVQLRNGDVAASDAPFAGDFPAGPATLKGNFNTKWEDGKYPSISFEGGAYMGSFPLTAVKGTINRDYVELDGAFKLAAYAVRVKGSFYYGRQEVFDQEKKTVPNTEGVQVPVRQWDFLLDAQVTDGFPFGGFAPGGRLRVGRFYDAQKRTSVIYGGLDIQFPLNGVQVTVRGTFDTVGRFEIQGQADLKFKGFTAATALVSVKRSYDARDNPVTTVWVRGRVGVPSVLGAEVDGFLQKTSNDLVYNLKGSGRIGPSGYSLAQANFELSSDRGFNGSFSANYGPVAFSASALVTPSWAVRFTATGSLKADIFGIASFTWGSTSISFDNCANAACTGNPGSATFRFAVNVADFLGRYGVSLNGTLANNESSKVKLCFPTHCGVEKISTGVGGNWGIVKNAEAKVEYGFHLETSSIPGARYLAIVPSDIATDFTATIGADVWLPCVPDFWHECPKRVDVGASGSFSVSPFRIQVGTRIAGIWIGFTLPP